MITTEACLTVRVTPSLRPLRRRQLGWSIAAVVVVLVSAATLLLRGRVQSPFGQSVYDTLLYVRQVQFLNSHAWLGPYDQMTLAKVPGYALFVSGCDRLSLPVKDGEQLVVLAAALAAAACVLVLTRRLSWSVASFVVLALDPLYLTAPAADLSRDPLFASVSLLLLATLFLTGHLALVERRVAAALSSGVVAGLALGSYLLLREEGPAVLPIALGALGTPVLLRLRRTGTWRISFWPRGYSHRVMRPALRLGAAAVVVGLAAGGPLAFVMAENKAHYGVALTSDLASGSFLDAYAQWQRVEAGPRIHHVPINRAQRQAVYTVSSAARRLEPVLESPDNVWLRRACGGRASARCDYPGDWTVWVLRDAAARIGVFRSAPHVQSFFTDLAEQIAAACANGQLICRAKLPSSLQSVQRTTWRELAASFGRITTDLVNSRSMYWNVASAAPVPRSLRAHFAAADPALAATRAAAVAAQHRFEQHRWQYQTLYNAYTALLPAASVLGLMSLVCALATRLGRRRAAPLAGLALVLLLGILTRIALLSVVDAADYDADQPRYLYPAHTMLLAFAVVAILVGVQAFGPELRRRRFRPLEPVAAMPSAVPGDDEPAVERTPSSSSGRETAP